MAAFSANNTFLTPTGPTLLIVRHFREARDLAPGRFPSTHITKCCLSILGGPGQVLNLLQSCLHLSPLSLLTKAVIYTVLAHNMVDVT